MTENILLLSVAIFAYLISAFIIFAFLLDLKGDFDISKTLWFIYALLFPLVLTPLWIILSESFNIIYKELKPHLKSKRVKELEQHVRALYAQIHNLDLRVRDEIQIRQNVDMRNRELVDEIQKLQKSKARKK